MITPLIGVGLLLAVFVVALGENTSGEIGFLSIHAAVVVFGGVFGSLFLAIDRSSLWRMLLSMRDVFPSTSISTRVMANNERQLQEIKAAWRTGQRRKVLELADSDASPEVRLAADVLLNQVSGLMLVERFGEVKAGYTKTMQPIIEGWDIVNRLAPSFGMIGTVAGMIQLFKNMGGDSGSLGGSMAMALLATLYGIAFGAAVGGPMMARVNNQLNARLGYIDLLEQTVAALIDEDKHRSA